MSEDFHGVFEFSLGTEPPNGAMPVFHFASLARKPTADQSSDGFSVV